MTDRYKPPSQKVSTPVILVDPATGEAYTSLSPLPVSSDPPVGGATEAEQEAQTAILAALHKSEDAAHSSGDAGIGALAVRQDTLASLVDTDSDYANIKVDALGRLWVTGTWLEDAAHASGAAGHFVLAVRNDAGTALATTDGDYIGFTTDARGHLWVAGSQVEDAAHGSGDRGIYTLAVIQGTLSSSAGDGDYGSFKTDTLGRLWITGTYLEDVAHAGGDAGHFVLAVRSDTATALATTDGDYIPFIVDSTGKLWTAGTYLIDAAAGGTDKAVSVAGIRDDALTALTPVDGDYTNFRMDKWGRLHVRESLDEYEAVAASATDQALGATGATGDILAQLIIIPATTSPGAVSIKDGAGSAITVFAGGVGSVATLHPIIIPLGLRSTAGAWSVTTGTNVSALASGEFT